MIVSTSGYYVKADGRELAKADYPELYAMKGDVIDDLSSYTITSSGDRSPYISTSVRDLYPSSFGGLEQSQPMTVTLDGKFITVGCSPSNGRVAGSTTDYRYTSIAVSSSDDGESWTVPSYSIPAGKRFVGIRTFSTGVFIITNTGVYRSIDYGKTFEPVFTQDSLLDIAFDGVSTYVVLAASRSVYYGDIVSGGMTKITVSGNLNGVS